MEHYFPGRHRASLVVDLLIALFSVAIIILSGWLDSRAKLFPDMVAWCTLVLVATDIVAQSETRLGRAVFTFFAGATEAEDREAEARKEIRAISYSVAWIFAFVLAVWLFGFLPVIPVYLFVSMRVFGDNSTLRSIATTVLIMAIIWGFFEYALDYTLYRGVLWELVGLD